MNAKGFLVDTDFLIDLLSRPGKSRQEAAKALFFQIVALGPLWITGIVVSELFTGIKGSEAVERVRSFLGHFKYLSVSMEEAVEAGRIRGEYLAKGLTLGVEDATNAAIAKGRHLVLVTNNVRHYPMLDSILKWQERRMRIPAGVKTRRDDSLGIQKSF